MDTGELAPGNHHCYLSKETERKQEKSGTWAGNYVRSSSTVPLKTFNQSGHFISISK